MSKTFEIVAYVRDINGNVTNAKKSFSSDNASEIATFYNRIAGVYKKKKRKKVEAASKEEAEKILKSMQQDDND